MSEGIRPLKRARVDEGAPVASSSTHLPLQNLKRQEELWFDDGNLILTGRDTGFWIYRGLLASQSTVFSDMLLSSSPSAEETLDGCPIVHVSDSPEDLVHFLRVPLPGSQKRWAITITTISSPPYRTDILYSTASIVVKLILRFHSTRSPPSFASLTSIMSQTYKIRLCSSFRITTSPPTSIATGSSGDFVGSTLSMPSLLSTWPDRPTHLAYSPRPYSNVTLWPIGSSMGRSVKIILPSTSPQKTSESVLSHGPPSSNATPKS